MSYTHTESRDGYTITLSFEDEQITPVDVYGEDHEDIAEICFRINHGLDEWVTAKVSASIAGVDLCNAYLGAVHYKCGELHKFIDDGYYQDMVVEALEGAKARVAEIMKAAA